MRCLEAAGHDGPLEEPAGYKAFACQGQVAGPGAGGGCWADDFGWHQRSARQFGGVIDWVSVSKKHIRPAEGLWTCVQKAFAGRISIFGYLIPHAPEA